MDAYEERNNIRDQRRKLLESMRASTADVEVPRASEDPAQPEVGRNDGSEAGGTAPVGGEIDLDSARQQYKALTGSVASAKWSGEQIAEKIAQWRAENESGTVGAGEGTGQTGPLTKEDEKEADAQLVEAQKEAEAELKASEAKSGEKKSTK